MVKWVGLKKSANTWEPAENLDFVTPAPNPSNNENTDYEVEKVLKKREKKGQVLFELELLHFYGNIKLNYLNFSGAISSQMGWLQ